MFGTSGIRGRLGEDVTSSLAVDVGRAVASEGAARVVVGRDARVGSDYLADAVMAGLRECGADAVELGRTPTPTVARAVGWEDADAGVMITASHNPPQDNGVKLWNPCGVAYVDAQRAAVTRRILDGDFDFADHTGVGSRETAADATDRHVRALVDATGALDGVDVVVDVGNGAGRLTADAFERAGASVTTLNAQPDGRFPGRPSEPTRDNLGALRALTRAEADLGVAHDGDADRMVAVDETGRVVSGDVLLALFALDIVEPGDAVSAPVNTSLVVDDRLAERDASVVRTQVGDVYVAEAALSDDVVFGGEPSGSWIFPAETLCPDGPLAALTLARRVRTEGALSEQVEALGEYPIRRDSVAVDSQESVMEAVTEAVEADYGDVETVDGVRVTLDDAWFLLRPSGTEPLVRITAEARDAARADAVFEEASELLEDARQRRLV